MHLAPVLSCSLLFSFFFFFFTKSIELSQVVLSSFNEEKVVNQKEKTSKDFLIVCPKLDDSRGEFDCRNEFFITQVTVKNDVNYIGGLRFVRSGKKFGSKLVTKQLLVWV